MACKDGSVTDSIKSCLERDNDDDPTTETLAAFAVFGARTALEIVVGVGMEKQRCGGGSWVAKFVQICSLVTCSDYGSKRIDESTRVTSVHL